MSSADLNQRVASGDRLRIKAAAWNSVLDAARWVQDREQGRTGPPESRPDGFPAADVVRVRNDTGGDLDRGAVLTPTDEILDATVQPLAVQRMPVFAGEAPAATSDPVLILLEPVASDGIGRAVVAGIAVCDVNVTSAAHQWARPTAANTDRLESAAGGPARILQREAGSSGLKRAVVLLTGGSAAGAGADTCFRFLADLDITGIACDGEGNISTVYYTKTFNWFKNGVVYDTDPGCP